MTVPIPYTRGYYIDQRDRTGWVIERENDDHSRLYQVVSFVKPRIFTPHSLFNVSLPSLTSLNIMYTGELVRPTIPVSLRTERSLIPLLHLLTLDMVVFVLIETLNTIY